MDITSLYYFKELCKDLNMTHTAARLYISQQTLSNHILRMEDYYGAALFNRKPRLCLTDAGRFALQFAENVLESENRFKNILFDIEKQKRGLLRFGASSLRMNNCIPHILPDFSKEYPEVQVQLFDYNSARLEELVNSRELDLAVCVMDEDMPALVSQAILSDQIYLCVSDHLLINHFGHHLDSLKQKSIHGARLADFSSLPFFLYSAPNRLSATITKCFEEADCVPDVYLSATQTRLASSVCSNALAACFITHMNLSNTLSELDASVNIFPLLYQGKPLYHSLSLVWHTKQYLSHYAQYFMSLLQAYFERIDQIPMARLADAG